MLDINYARNINYAMLCLVRMVASGNDYTNEEKVVNSKGDEM